MNAGGCAARPLRRGRLARGAKLTPRREGVIDVSVAYVEVRNPTLAEGGSIQARSEANTCPIKMSGKGRPEFAIDLDEDHVGLRRLDAHPAVECGVLATHWSMPAASARASR